VSHLYNLRQQPRYRERRLRYVKTRPTAVAIGERRRPDPQGQPGYLRVDTVHQGDPPGGKGVYHIDAVDEVTQWQIVSASARISEAWLEPVLEAMLRQFPFRILGFHSDNGSEFIIRVIAGMLQKLLIEQTKSRPRQSNDNGLVETKNGAVIRKHLGYGSIDPDHAERLQEFYSAPTSIPISTIIVRARKPTSKSTKRAANKGFTAATRRRSRRCSPCPNRNNTCVQVSLWPSCDASRQPTATPKPRSVCSKPNANCSSNSNCPWLGRGNDGRE
jgi:transposase InsO family protein